MRTSQRLAAVEVADLGWKDIVASSFVVVVGWLGRIAWARIDSKADRAELQRALDAMEKRDDESRESRQVIHDKLDLVIADATRTAVSVARLEGSNARLLRHGD